MLVLEASCYEHRLSFPISPSIGCQSRIVYLPSRCIRYPTQIKISLGNPCPTQLVTEHCQKHFSDRESLIFPALLTVDAAIKSLP